MTPEDEQLIKTHARSVAVILCQNTEIEKLQNLEDIELVVRARLLEIIRPRSGIFVEAKTQATAGKPRISMGCN